MWNVVRNKWLFMHFQKKIFARYKFLMPNASRRTQVIHNHKNIRHMVRAFFVESLAENFGLENPALCIFLGRINFKNFSSFPECWIQPARCLSGEHHRFLTVSRIYQSRNETKSQTSANALHVIKYRQIRPRCSIFKYELNFHRMDNFWNSPSSDWFLHQRSQSTWNFSWPRVWSLQLKQIFNSSKFPCVKNIGAQMIEYLNGNQPAWYVHVLLLGIEWRQLWQGLLCQVWHVKHPRVWRIWGSIVTFNVAGQTVAGYIFVPWFSDTAVSFQGCSSFVRKKGIRLKHFYRGSLPIPQYWLLDRPLAIFSATKVLHVTPTSAHRCNPLWWQPWPCVQELSNIHISALVL